MYNIVAIYGKSGAGKDTLLNRLCKYKNYHKIISYTTRLPREREQNGVDYHFIDNIEFAEKVKKEDMLEYVVFNNHWYYGTCVDDLMVSKINVGVYDPYRIKSLMKIMKQNPNKYNILFCYLYADDKTLLLRSLNRELYPNCSEICRRFLSDKKDFDNFNEWLNSKWGDMKRYPLLMVNANDDLLLQTSSAQNIVDQINQFFH